MCIRDRGLPELVRKLSEILAQRPQRPDLGRPRLAVDRVFTCLLYTSDAADERSSVDLGGRRIIKKKNNNNMTQIEMYDNNNTRQGTLQLMRRRVE